MESETEDKGGQLYRLFSQDMANGTAETISGTRQ